MVDQGKRRQGWAIASAWDTLVDRVADRAGHDAGDAVLAALTRSHWANHKAVRRDIAAGVLASSDPAWFFVNAFDIDPLLSRKEKTKLFIRDASIRDHYLPVLDELPIVQSLIEGGEVISNDSIIQCMTLFLSVATSYSMTSSFTLLIPLISRLLLDSRSERKVLLDWIRILFIHVDLPVLREHSSILIDIIRRQLGHHDSDVAFESVALTALTVGLTRMVPRRPHRRPNDDVPIEISLKFIHGELKYRALSNSMGNEHRVAAYLSCLPQLIAIYGINYIRCFREFAPCLFVFVEQIEHPNIVQLTCDILEMIMRVCWPRMNLHSGKLFESICRTWLKLHVFDTPADIMERLIPRLIFVMRLLRGVIGVSSFDVLSEPARHLELVSHLYDRVVDESGTFSSTKQLDFQSAVDFDNKFIYDLHIWGQLQ